MNTLYTQFEFSVTFTKKLQDFLTRFGEMVQNLCLFVYCESETILINFTIFLNEFQAKETS